MFKWLTSKFSTQIKQSEYDMRQILVRGEDAYFFDKSYYSLATQGYCKNIIAYHCINKIAAAVADIPVIVSVNGNEIDFNDPIAGVDTLSLARPNPKQSYTTFMFDAICYRLISGNTYFHLVKGDIRNTPFSIELFRPDRVYIDVVNGIPRNYVYTYEGKQYYYNIEEDTNISEVLQVKCFNPIDDLYGLSPISAAMLAIGQYNEAALWNKALLQNASKPAGILSMRDRGDNAPNLGIEQMESINKQINSKFAGARNSGKVITLNYDMQWQSMSFSPTDMDWINGKNSSARDICLAFGYPTFLLGLPEGATFNNVAEAKLALYEETVIPLANSMLDELSYWLSATTGLDIKIVPDLDKVSALTPRRQIARENARLDVAAGIITVNEAREEIGYEEVAGGDEIMVPAGKLPLNFDTGSLVDTTPPDEAASKSISDLTDKEFFDHLVESGFEADGALKITALTINRE